MSNNTTRPMVFKTIIEGKDLSADNFVQGFTFTDYNVHIFRDELKDEFLAKVTPDVGDIWHFGISREYFEYLSESREELREGIARAVIDILYQQGSDMYKLLAEARNKALKIVEENEDLMAAKAIDEFKKEKSIKLRKLIKFRKKKLGELVCPRCGAKCDRCYWHNDAPNGCCSDCEIYICDTEFPPHILRSKLLPRSSAKDIESGDFIPYEDQYFYDTDHNTFKKIVAGEIVGCEEELMEPMGKGVCLPCWGKDS